MKSVQIVSPGVIHKIIMTGTLTQDFLDGFSWDKRDVRLDDWPMMSTIWPTAILSLLYLYFAKLGGPRFMKDRAPYNLTGVIMAYNLFQVVANIWLFYGYLTNGWLRGYSLSKWILSLF